MTKILLLCHDIPSMTVGATLPFYHLIKQLGRKYDIQLISFNSQKYDISDIKKFLIRIDTLNIPEYLNIKDQLIYTVKNMISIDNIKTRSFLNYYYRSDMKKLIMSFVDNVDLIISDMPMAFYVKNVKKPKIVYAFDAVSNYNYNMYTKAESLPSKIYWYMNYLKIHRYEKTYEKFDSCILVNKKDKEILEKDINMNYYVIPNGVDTEFFKNDNEIHEKQIVFLGDMSTPPNNDAVRYFVEKIYPTVLSKKEIPFYVVGRNPTEFIKELENDENIIVTGSVVDVRHYLTRGTVFITPMISGTGIKNKILEAMSMNLPVISTSIGINGINAKNNEEFLLDDDENDFAEDIIKLTEDDILYEKLGRNARIFVKDNYSWETSMQKMDKIIKKLIT